MKKLYLDLDDTVKETERYIRRVIELNSQKPVPETDTIYSHIHTDDWYEFFIKEALTNYDAIPFKRGARQCIEKLKSLYDVWFVSGYSYIEEANAKEVFAKEMGVEAILLPTGGITKSNIDMEGCTLVDDRLDILLSTNAQAKIKMDNPYYPTGYSEKVEVVYDWGDLMGKLNVMEA